MGRAAATTCQGGHRPHRNFDVVGNFAEGRKQCPSNVGKGASATTAPELLRRKDVLRAVGTIPRRLRPQLKQQRHCNACQRDAGNDASGNFAEEGNLVKDDDFSTKDDLAEDGNVAE